MDFNLDEEQRALRDMARGLLAQTSAYEQRRAAVLKAPGYDVKAFSRLGEQGLLGLAIPEAYGGSDATLLEAGIVAREIGRVLAPEPYRLTVVTGLLIAETGTEAQRVELLPAMCAAESVVAFAHSDPRTLGATEATSVEAVESAEGWLLTGNKEPVELGAEADHLIVAARLPDGGTGLFIVAGHALGLQRHSYRTNDGGRVARLSFSATPAAPLGDFAVDASAHIDWILSVARVLGAQEALGAMEAALSMTTTYLTQRQQFGRTLNTFQALTFRAADMYVEIELADSLTQWATMVAAEGHPDLRDASTRAAAKVARAARHVAEEAIQLHGGIGMTAEHPIGAFAQRLTALVQMYGTRDRHIGELARTVDDHDTIEPLQTATV